MGALNQAKIKLAHYVLTFGTLEGILRWFKRLSMQNTFVAAGGLILFLFQLTNVSCGRSASKVGGGWSFMSLSSLFLDLQRLF